MMIAPVRAINFIHKGENNMQTRYNKVLGKDVSLFGLGTMRMPTKVVDGKTVMDREECIRMIRHAIDSGVTYVDTAYPYHGGESEIVTGLALQDGYRERVTLTTKLPVWLVKEPADVMRLLDEQLEKLQTDHIDYYLVHALDAKKWENTKKNNVLEILQQAKAEGKIRHIGCSFHDSYTVFEQIVNSFDWELVQIQLNFLDSDYQAGEKGLALLREKGIPCSIMEPLKGGKLAFPGNDEIAALWESYPEKRSAVEWAFRYLADQEGINVVLSGSSSMEQMCDTMSIFSKEDMVPGCLSEEEHELIGKVRKIYNDKMFVQCTACAYCMPCPMGVNIPEIFHWMNDGALAESYKRSREHYQQEAIHGGFDASRCVECGACESHCPQSISIREKLKEAHAVLA